MDLIKKHYKPVERNRVSTIYVTMVTKAFKIKLNSSKLQLFLVKWNLAE